MIVIYVAHVLNDNNTSRCYFHVLKILIFWVHRGVKGQKMVQNDKKFCLSRSISSEPTSYDFHSRCTCNISPGIFFLIFQNFDFQGCQGVERTKMAQSNKKICLLRLMFQEPYIFIYCTPCVNDNICRHFFSVFQSFNFWNH